MPEKADWGESATVGALYRVAREIDLMRVGDNWMKGRLRVGDLLLCMAHAGDHLYTYMLVEERLNGLRGLVGVQFDALSLGVRSPWQPNPRQRMLLEEGSWVATIEPTETRLIDAGSDELVTAYYAALRLRPCARGLTRKWVRCKEEQCGQVFYYDYIAYAVTNPVLTKPCGHSNYAVNNSWARLNVVEVPELVALRQLAEERKVHINEEDYQKELSP